jgi:hypothetical protein
MIPKVIEGITMSRVRVSWDNEAKTIVRYDFEYGWTWLELEVANNELREMMKTIHHEICMIANQAYPQHYLPPNPLSKIGAMLPSRSPQLSLTVVVSGSSLITSVLNLIIKVYPSASHLRFANNLEEARAMIRRFVIQKDY